MLATGILQLGLQLHSATSEVELLKSKLHDVCSQLTPRACDPLQVDNDELTQRAKDEIANLRRQVTPTHTCIKLLFIFKSSFQMNRLSVVKLR